MQANVIKKHITGFTRHFPTTLPPLGWYFSVEIPDRAIELPADTWTCMFRHLNDVVQGKRICFSRGAAGCSGAACYLGFTVPHENAGRFLAGKEQFKKTAAFGQAFYRQIAARQPKKKYLVLSRLGDIEDHIDVEVLNFWVKPLSLAGLVTLSNFDSAENNLVRSPFASGCQSLWTIPYKEGENAKPRATIGALDPAMRKYIPDDVLAFSVPCNRFVELAENIESSFARTGNWLALIQGRA